MKQHYPFRGPALLCAALLAVQFASAQGCPATVDQPAAQTVCSGAPVAAVAFSGNASSYTWTNTHAGIGLPLSGSGSIGAFTAVNNSGIPVTATVTVTPQGVVTAPNAFAYIPNKGNDNVSVYNTATGAVVTTIPVGQEPMGVQVSPDGSRVYIANSGSDNVSVIATLSNTVIGTVPVVDAPYGMTISPDGARLYVANRADHSISVINTATLTPVDTIFVGQDPVGLAMSPDGNRLYVCNSGSNSVSVIRTSDNTVLTTVPNIGGAPEVLITSPDGSRVYVSNLATDQVTVIDATADTVLTRITVGLMPFGLVTSPDGARLYVSNFNSANIAVINTLTNDVTSFIPLTGNSSPAGLSINADGSRLYVTQENINRLATVITATGVIETEALVGVMPVSLGSFLTLPQQACAGAAKAFTVTIKPLPSVAAIGNRALCPDETLVLPFTGSTGADFSWTNNLPSIGLPAAGTGAILAFDAVNNNATAQVASVAVTPLLDGCTGAARSFTITVNPRPQKPVITVVGNSLRSPQATGNRWFIDNVQIPGVASQLFTPLQNGNYSLQVLMPGSPCPSLLSDPVAFVATSVADRELESGLSLWPVPATTVLQLRGAAGLGLLRAQVYSVSGSPVGSPLRFQQSASIGLGGLPAGVYYVEVLRERGGTRTLRSFVKQ